MDDEIKPGEPFMDAVEFGHSLGPGIGLNLLVSNTAKHRNFAVAVLGAKVLHHSDDFSVFSLSGSIWMIHADHTYKTNVLYGVATQAQGRGAGAELRAYGVDPDMAAAAAREGGWTVLAGAEDKPHGLREAVILDDDGYAWVPGVTI
jgi:catechol 2,3-dioxygenase-like lactoylglutathione lyase family enzyme